VLYTNSQLDNIRDMPFIYRQLSRSRFWIARFKMPDGVWVSRTTKQTNKGIAQGLAYEWAGVAASPAELNPTGAAIARVVREIYERATNSKVETVTVGQYVLQWMERVGTSKAANTAQRYRHVAASFLRHLGPAVSGHSLAAITPTVLQGYIDAESATGKSAHTVALAGKTIQTIFKSALRAGLVEHNPAASLELPDYSMREREEFTPDELQALLKEAKGTGWETVILLGAYGGCRLGDAVSMKWESVDLAARRLSYVPQKASRGRRRKTMELPLSQRLHEHLKALAARKPVLGSEPITPDLSVRHIGGRGGLSMTFKKLMQRAGVAGKTTTAAEGTAARSFNTKSFHSLRHFFVSQLRRAGADLEAAQAAAGHSDAASHARYDHDKRDRVQRNIAAAVDRMPGAGKAKK